jgi:prepilin peptidase CpaA
MNLSFLTEQFIPYVAVALVALAAYSDLRWRKIPNCLTLPAIALGFGLNFLGNSWNGLLAAGLGFAIGIGLFILPWILGGIGGGDVKLLGALGALLGSYAVLNIFLYSSLVGGVIAVALALANKGLLEMFKRMWLFFKCIFLFRAPATGALVFKESPVMPYGTAIAAGTLLFIFAGAIV